MIIQLPSTVAFPVTIGQLLKQQGDDVPRLAPLLTYTFKSKYTEIPEFGEEKEVVTTLSGQFDAPIEGRLERWLVQPGTVIERNGVGIVEIEEPCTHEVQFSGLCAQCGKDMTEQDYNSYFTDKDRATICLAHDSNGLTVSEDEARRHEEQAKRRLLKERKLSLVVDLDQTIIHACVDPSIGEWKDDPFCVNHEAVKDVRAFRLEEDVTGGRGTWYYLKLRPGLKEFLERICQIYELHIYTMGTRAYALAVKKIVDPDGSIFGERVLSRDENGNMTSKSLARLFPVDTKMVVIIDDRGDVWDWSNNLLRVKPYDFFVGIGDINSTFLPKKQQELPPTIAAAATPAEAAGNPEMPLENKEEEEEGLGDDLAAQVAAETALGPDAVIPPAAIVPPTALETLITMGGGTNQQLITDQAEQLDKVIEAQKEARPLARKQELQDKIDEKAAELAALTEGASNDTPSDAGAHKHSVLQDNDNELVPLEQHLTAVHRKFFEEFEANKGAKKDRVSQLKKHPRKRPAPEDPDDFSAVPDVAVIMPEMKRKDLSDVVVCFTGFWPVGTDIRNLDTTKWAKQFGIQVVEHVSPMVTHVIAGQTRTAKIKQAAKQPHIKIVTLGWLHDCFLNWKHQPEGPYEIKIHPDDRKGTPSLSPSFDITMTNPDAPVLSDSDSDDEDDESGLSGSEFDSDLDSEGTADKPINMTNVGWTDVDEEFADFFGDDPDLENDSGNESTHSDTDAPKRKRTDVSSTDGNSDSEMDDAPPVEDNEDASPATPEDPLRSRLAKRQKVAKDRADAGSALKVVEVSSKPPTPTSSTDTSTAPANENPESQDYDDSDSLADDLDRELFALDDFDEEEDEGAEQQQEGDASAEGDAIAEGDASAPGDAPAPESPAEEDMKT